MQKLKSINIKNIIIAVVFFYFGFFVFVFIFSYHEFFAAIIQSIAVLAAAFVGAWFAFLLQSKSKKADEINKQVSASNRAIFTLLQRINKLRLYQKNLIDPHRKKVAAFLYINATNDFEKDDTYLDISSLNFLIDYEHPEILMDLYMEDQNYKVSKDCINRHAELHINQVQHLLEKAGFIENKDYNIDFFKNALGARVYLTLERTINDLIDSVDRTIETSMETKDKFQKVLKSIFHGKIIIDFELIVKNNSNPSLPIGE